MKLPYWEPLFHSDLLRPFWQAIDEGDLKLPACSVCGAWQWYPLGSIPCHPEADLIWKSVPKTGTIYTFTTAHRCFLPGDQKNVVPYTNALIELDGMPGVRLITLMVNMRGHDPEIGMPVRFAPTKVRDQTLPTFEPDV